jgi:hypothetical protein
MIAKYKILGIFIITCFAFACANQSILIDVKEPHSKKRNGIVNEFYDNGKIQYQTYYIDGQSIFRIYYDKHGQIKTLLTFVDYPERNYGIYIFGNNYKRGKLTWSKQLDLDSLNRFYDIKTINNGKISIDSLNQINDSINHRDRFPNWDTTLIPFKIKIVKNKDTILNGFDFSLSKDSKFFFPLKSERFNCFFFKNVDSICDFNLNFNNKKITFRHIETVRLMHESEWIITINPEASDSCFDIMRAHSGCFANVWEKEISKCPQNNFIFIRNFEIRY